MSDILNQIKFYPNMVDPNVLLHIYDSAINSWDWGFQNSGTPDVDSLVNNFKFLMLKISNQDQQILSILDSIQNITGDKFKLDRTYINAQHFGMPGKPHVDNNNPDKYTLLIYLNPEWNYMWGGQTVFLDEYIDVNTKEHIRLSNEAVIKFPVFNCGVLFPSNIYHYAEAPTKEYLDFRMTLALKLQKLS